MLQRRRRLALDRRRQPGRRVRRRRFRRSIIPPVTISVDAVGPARLGRHRSSCRARSSRTSSRRCSKLIDHAERAPRSLAQLRRPQPGDHGVDRAARRPTTGRPFPSAATRSSARGRRRMYHLTDRVSVWGAANSGFRAPTLTELYRQFSVGAITTRPNDQTRTRAAGRRRSGRQRRAGAATSRPG